MNNSSIERAIPAGLVSLEQYTSAHFVIYQIIIPIISLVGIVGNGMCLVILANNKAKYAFGTYLKVLTISDICVLVVAIVRFGVDMSGKFINAETFNTLQVYEQRWNGLFVRTFFQHLIASFVTIISVERFVAVLFPLNVKSFVLDRYPRRVVSITTAVYVIFAIPALFFHKVYTIIDPVTNKTTNIIGRTEFGKSYLQIVAVFNTVVKVLVPTIAVVSTTMAIVFYMRCHKSPRENSGNKLCFERDKMTIVLVVIATFFTCNATAALLITGIRVFFPYLIKRQPLLFLLCTEARLVLVCLNSANDFVIYILSSKRFRKIMYTKFCCCRFVRETIVSTSSFDKEARTSEESANTSHLDISCISDMVEQEHVQIS